MIKLNHVSFSYQNGEANEMQVLSDVSFQASRGECVVLCGKSGCGKTTMLRLVNGLIPHFYAGKLEGNVLVGGQEMQQTPLPQTSRIVGSVFQNPRTQFFHLDTTGEMAFNLENQNVPRPQMKKRLEEVSYRLNLQELMDRNIFELSGGEKQQIACGSVYAALPPVIVMDEPSSNLDMESIRKLQKLIRMMKDEGKTVLISEHRLWYLEGIADRYVLLEDGRIRQEFTPEAAADLSLEKRKALGLRAVKREQLYELRPDMGLIKQKSTGLDIDGLQFSRHMRQVLNVPHLEIPSGAIVAVIGENGAGKSTLLSLVCADNPQSYACDIELFGRKRGSGESIWDIKRHIGYVSPEMHRAYLKDLPAIDIVASGLNDSVGLYVHPRPEQRAVCEWWMDIFGIAGLKDRTFLKLSSGEQRLCLLARAFVKDPELLILDEPLHGLDDRNRQLTREIISAFCRRKDKTMIMVTHYAEELPDVITHNLFLKKNK